MVPNCYGCEYEFEEACRYIRRGHHLATSKDLPMSENIGKRGHFGIIIVDNAGKIVSW